VSPARPATSQAASQLEPIPDVARAEHERVAARRAHDLRSNTLAGVSPWMASGGAGNPAHRRRASERARADEK
jgi:hypothetical protein